MLCCYVTPNREQGIRSKALQGLTQLLIGAPRLMLLAERDGIVKEVLGTGAGEVVVVQALRGFKDILSAEEERVESGMARENMAASGKGVSIAQRVQGDQDAESSVVGGVLQMHVGGILSRLFHRSGPVRGPAVGLLGIMLRQGLVNPLEMVPQLLALQSDHLVGVRAEALRLLTLEEGKGGDFIRTRFLDGLLMGYT
ncbi:unnamed protein product [Discosporangium mesarthrocarpum]